ncbi:MAG: hypothetical protein H0T47_04575 [Planctomycetaceae bacterium]|nr:hypothetical protein [Planctomycetaceae bacterium]
MLDEARRKHSRAFLTKGLEKARPTREEFTAYGQACLLMADGLFQLLQEQEAVLFASAIPANVVRPTDGMDQEYLRKDHVFLFERFFYLLEEKQEHGLLVFDETDKVEDRRFVGRLERYFTRTTKGRYRTAWIVPTPFFVSSDMTSPYRQPTCASTASTGDFGCPRVEWMLRSGTRSLTGTAVGSTGFSIEAKSRQRTACLAHTGSYTSRSLIARPMAHKKRGNAFGTAHKEPPPPRKLSDTLIKKSRTITDTALFSLVRLSQVDLFAARHRDITKSRGWR